MVVVGCQPLTGESMRWIKDTVSGLSNPHDASARNRISKVRWCWKMEILQWSGPAVANKKPFFLSASSNLCIFRSMHPPSQSLALKLYPSPLHTPWDWIWFAPRVPDKAAGVKKNLALFVGSKVQPLHVCLSVSQGSVVVIVVFPPIRRKSTFFYKVRTPPPCSVFCWLSADTPRPPLDHFGASHTTHKRNQMQKYVQQGGDVNKPNKLGDTPLHEVRPTSSFPSNLSFSPSLPHFTFLLFPLLRGACFCDCTVYVVIRWGYDELFNEVWKACRQKSKKLPSQLRAVPDEPLLRRRSGMGRDVAVSPSTGKYGLIANIRSAQFRQWI